MIQSHKKTSWWRHQMETFSALLALFVGNSPVTGEFPTQRPVTQSFDVFFYLGLNKQLSKQSWGWCFEMPLWSLLCHCNASSVLLSAMRCRVFLMNRKMSVTITLDCKSKGQNQKNLFQKIWILQLFIHISESFIDRALLDQHCVYSRDK